MQIEAKPIKASIGAMRLAVIGAKRIEAAKLAAVEAKSIEATRLTARQSRSGQSQ
jgi:hypothetical protein